jgi:hypothetical protein
MDSILLVEDEYALRMTLAIACEKKATSSSAPLTATRASTRRPGGRSI